MGRNRLCVGVLAISISSNHRHVLRAVIYTRLDTQGDFPKGRASMTLKAINGSGRQEDIAGSLADAIKDLIYERAGPGMSVALAIGILEICKAEIMLESMDGE